MVYNPVDVFGLSCPWGGSFYVCENCDVHFLGCCASDPGKDGSGVSNSPRLCAPSKRIDFHILQSTGPSMSMRLQLMGQATVANGNLLCYRRTSLMCSSLTSVTKVLSRRGCPVLQLQEGEGSKHHGPGMSRLKR